MKKRNWIQRALSVCLSAAMCLTAAPITPVEASKATITKVSELATYGLVWEFEAQEGDNTWALYNVASEKYLGHDEASGKYVTFNEQPEAVIAAVNTDGTISFTFSAYGTATQEDGSGDKPYLKIGSNDRASFGETARTAQLFVKEEEDGTVTYKKTSTIEEEKDYVIAMANGSDVSTSATSLFALSNSIYGTTGTSSARLESCTVTISGDSLVLEQEKAPDDRQIPTYTVPTGLTGVVGQSLADLTLPEGFTWESENVTWTSAGIYTYKATYTPEDTETYQPVTGIEITVSVSDTYLNLKDQGLIWELKKATEEDSWYLYNVASEKYLGHDSHEDDGKNISLIDDPEAVTIEQNDDGTWNIIFDTTKKSLSCGTGNKYSLGEQQFKTMFFEETKSAAGISFTKASALYDGQEYILAQPNRSQNSTITTETTLYGLTNQLSGTGSGARIESYPLTITDGAVDFLTSAADLGTSVPHKVVVSSEVANGTVTLSTEETYAGNIVIVTVSPADKYEFKSLTAQAGETTVTLTQLSDTQWYFSMPESDVTVTAVFEQMADQRETPEYTTPTGLVAALGDTLADVTLPAGFAFEEALTTKLDTAGTVTYHVTYTPENTDTYKEVTGISVEIQVKDTYQNIASNGMIWRLEKATEEDSWYLRNMLTNTYLGHDSTNTYIALNESPEAFTIEKNDDGSWTLTFSGTKAHLSVGSGNKYSLGEQSYKTMLFEKTAGEDGYTFQTATALTDGKDYILAMAYRNNNAQTTTLTSLYGLTNQIDENGGDTRILSYAVAIADGKVDILSTADDVEVAESYQVTMPAQTDHGTLSASGTEAFAGNTVTITAAPEDGYELASLTVLAGENEVVCTKVSDTQWIFRMPESNVTVQGTFERITYQVTETTPSHGTIEGLPDQAIQGETITLKVTPETGYALKELTVKGKVSGTEVELTETEDGYTFEMPAEGVTVKATFYQPTYTITKGVQLHGTLDLSQTEAQYGVNIFVTVTPVSGYELKELHVQSGDQEVAIQKAEEDFYFFKMPDGNVTITATFGLPTTEDEKKDETDNKNDDNQVTTPDHDQNQNGQQVSTGTEKEPSNSATETTVPTVKKLKVQQKGSALKVTFQKVSGATSYIIYRSTKKNSGYKKVKTIKAGKKLVYKDKKVKKGKKYYYKVVTVKGTAKSAKSKAVSKKVK